MKRMNFPRTARIALLLGLVIAVLLLGRHLTHRDKKARTWQEWPVSLNDPLAIPTQAGLSTQAGPEENPDEARETWERALQGFRSASSDAAAIQQTAPLLREISLRWPRSDYAVLARLFSINTLASYASDKANFVQSEEFIERAIQWPQSYFSVERQASTQAVAASVIQSLIEHDKKSEAWQLCLKLRWLAPRLDQIAPVCHRLMDNSPAIALAPKQTLTLISPLVTMNTIPPDKLTVPLVKAVQLYLSYPYDEDMIGGVSIELHKANFPTMSSNILFEYMQVDSKKEPYAEIEIDKLKQSSKRKP